METKIEGRKKGGRKKAYDEKERISVKKQRTK
jgi:hypothetical protein